MTLYLENLDAETRRFMLDELDYDIQHNLLHISPFLSGQGQRDYPNLLRAALENGTEETLAAALGQQRRIQRSYQKRKPGGGFTRLGGSPGGISLNVSAFRASGSDVPVSRARVYGCSGLSSSGRTGAFSIRLPAYITKMRSEK